MKTKIETFRMILAKAAAVAAIMIMAFAVLPQQVSAAPGRTVHISTSAELKNALADTGVDTIIFKNNITAEVAMPIAPKRTNTNLVIDGNGYTFTERKTSTYDCTAGIKLTETTTIDTITIQNMNILGRNGYGTIYTCKKINQVFKNVTYTGPQMVYNDYGSVRIEDSTINIGQYNGNTYNGEVAEANQITLAGDVSITKTGNSSNVIFWLKNSGAGITVEDGANVTVNNDKNTNNCSGLIYASASYNFNIGNNAVFGYAGKYYFEETCKLNNFAMGTDSEFNVRLNNNLTSKLIYASNAVTVGDGSAVNISIAGNSASYVMYACKDITLEANSNVDIQTGNVTSGYIMKSYSGNINVGESASVNIETGAVTCGYVVKAYCGSITIGKNADFVVNSYGVMKNNLMWVKRNLTVKEGAVLDLIANKNSNTCCNYVLYVNGGCAAPSTITYENPERVLFYNDNTTGKKSCVSSYAAYLGDYTSINFTVYSTEYWKSSTTTGGVAVLENADYRWYQDSVNDGSYNVKAVSKACAKGFNASFTPTGYVGDQKYTDSRAMKALEYYFGKTTCKGYNYEVCLWNGKPAAAAPELTGSKTVADTSRTDGNTIVGNTLKYTVTVKNEELSSSWENVVFKDELPAGVDFDDNSKVYVDGKETTDYTYKDGVLRVELGSISGGSSVEVSFTVTVNEDAYMTTITNTAEVAGDNGSIEVSDDGINVISDTPSPAGNKVSKNLSRDSVRGQVGDILEYTITVSNDKPNSIWSNVYVWDTIPEEVDFEDGTKVYLNGEEVAYTYDEDTRVLTVALGDIAGGKLDGSGKDTKTLVFNVVINELGYNKFIYNTAKIDSVSKRSLSPMQSDSDTGLIVTDQGQEVGGRAEDQTEDLTEDQIEDQIEDQNDNQ